jgi:SAM-dependent methyltransferase
LHRNDPSDPGYAGVLDAFLDSALSPFAPAPASIIDYGCGPVPALAGRARERGYRAAAWDPLFASSERNRTGLFDAALLHEVIEHCFEPSAALADAASLLKPGGILAVSTLFKPESPESFLRWWYREDPTHVCFFSRKSLCATAAFAGLVELACDGRSISVFRLP